MRAVFLTGAWRHVRSLPKLVFSVRGWTKLLADCIGQNRKPYQVCCRGARCELRPGTSDWWIFLEIFIFGIYTRAANDMRKANVIIDIGANVGLFAIYASSINPGADIYAIEPFPRNVEHLQRNLVLNANRQVHVRPEAVSNKTGVAELFFAPGDSSGCSLSQLKAQSCPVNVINVNDLFDLCKIEKCDLLKMDCEGSELVILEAMSSDMLAQIGAIIMEYHDPAEVDKILRILSNSGMKCEIHDRISTLYASRN
jgi:FkbM family methyltransferase